MATPTLPAQLRRLRYERIIHVHAHTLRPVQVQRGWLVCALCDEPLALGTSCYTGVTPLQRHIYLCRWHLDEEE